MEKPISNVILEEQLEPETLDSQILDVDVREEIPLAKLQALDSRIVAHSQISMEKIKKGNKTVKGNSKKDPNKGKNIVNQREKLEKTIFWQQLRKTWNYRLMITQAVIFLEVLLEIITTSTEEDWEILAGYQILETLILEYKVYAKENTTFPGTSFAQFEEFLLKDELYTRLWSVIEAFHGDLTKSVWQALKRTALVCSSSPHTISTSTSSTTARTVVDNVDAAISEESTTSDEDEMPCSTTKKLELSKKKSVSFAKKDEKKESQPTTSKKRSMKRAKTNIRTLEREESSSEEETIVRKKSKKIKNDSSSSSESETSSDSDHQRQKASKRETQFEDITELLSIRQVSGSNTGGISSNISINQGDSYINLSSEELRGKYVVDFKIYPFKDCLGTEKTQWWKKAMFRSQYVVSAEDASIKKQLIKLQRMLVLSMQRRKGFTSTVKPKSYGHFSTK